MYATDFGRLLDAKEGRDGYLKARCPAHDDHTPSLEIRDGQGVVLVRCWAGCELHAICSALGLTLRDLRHDQGIRYLPYPRPILRLYRPPESNLSIDAKAEARVCQVLRESERSKAGTSVERYLASRHLSSAMPDALRFHAKLFCSICHQNQETSPFHPGMIAPVTAPDGRIVSIHRTFLTQAGEKAHGPQSKKLMPAIAPGCTRGAAIRLFPAGEQLGVAEGIETALACHLLFQIPVWGAISSGGLARINIPREVERVEIFPDHDTPGLEAAKALGRRLIRSGRRFRIWTPPNPRSDWADVLFERANAERDTITNSQEAE